MEETTRAERGGWGKVATAEEGDAEPKAPRIKDRAKTIARDVGAAIEGRVAPAADRAARAVKSGAGTALRALEDPTAAQASEILAQADLPEVVGEDPLAELAVRLDREADLHRGIAMRQHARAAWMDRLGAIGAVVALVGIVVLASIAGFRALFAPEGALLASLLLGVGALLLLLGVFALARATARIRAGQAQSAREALVRSDLAEARLHRVAALLALRQLDPEAFGRAVQDLERDTRAAG
ncbi:hypothetical protein [Polyangium sorediatum]|uniref:Phage holin family protein n=1 Tax=Polyangium sorediatum TaxID=889274 RepID=A0ABT6NRD0_9BACT|nr:hypothetical protein [Polyangium sorediatum]MDI1430885.1 hypothetical protein [Polyangium sorediatum]